MEAFENHSEYFQLRCDAIEKRGLTPLIEYIASMWMLAYGIAADCVDEYLKIGACNVLEYIKKFTLGVIQVFWEENLRKANQADVITYCKLLKPMFFPVCWEVSITYTGSERIVQRVRKYHFKRNFIRCQLSSLKLLLHMTFVFGMPSSICLEGSMIHTSLTDYQFFESCINIGLLNMSMSSMTLSTR